MKELKELLSNNIARGLMQFDVVLNTKKELSMLRTILKEKGYTELKLLYRNGKYVVSVSINTIKDLELKVLGYKKLKKADRIEAKSIYPFKSLRVTY